ncbi:hypothetical protein Tsubulata_025538 [Turnera subulata]|uniref:Uncharacterized protein n=1 Tax=Turnera subulata TaxID=218843 RepID=A0A9Q0F8I6_9ROSI|nr:hypothetical protein Tsubulata_025538 [Turnera subulata]
MYRSSTTTSRSSDDFLVNLSPAPIASPLKATYSDELPVYDSVVSDSTKKEIALHNKTLGEKAVHLIPVVLILCALILWLSSHPAGRE